MLWFHVLGEQRGCPCSLCMPPHNSRACLPQLPAAATFPACSQLSADDGRDCGTAYSDAKPRLTSCWGAQGPCGPAVGTGQAASHGVPWYWCALCPMYAMVCYMCHGVRCEPLHLQRPITYPLYPPAITHHRHYTLQLPVTLYCTPIAHVTYPLTFNYLCSLHTHCRAFFLHLHTHHTPISHPSSLCYTPSAGPLQHLLHTFLCTAVARLFAPLTLCGAWSHPHGLCHTPWPVSHPQGLCETPRPV